MDFPTPYLVAMAAFWLVQALLGWKVASRAGFSTLAGLAVGIPVVGYVIIWTWAINDWPNVGSDDGKMALVI